MSTRFGSFSVPATHAMHPSVALHPGLQEELILPDRLDRSKAKNPVFELIVTSTKALKWKPALDYWDETFRYRVEGFQAEDIEDIIESEGLDPNEAMTVEGEFVRLQTVKATSGVPEQPIGPDEGARGAMQRATSGDGAARKGLDQVAAEGRWGAIVSFESYFAFEKQDLSGKPASWHASHGFSVEGAGADARRAYFDNRGRIAVDRAAAYVELELPSGRQRVLTVSDGVAAPMAYVRAALEMGRTTTVGKLMAGIVEVPDLLPLGVSHDSWHGEFIVGLRRETILLRALRHIPIYQEE